MRFNYYKIIRKVKPLTLPQPHKNKTNPDEDIKINNDFETLIIKHIQYYCLYNSQNPYITNIDETIILETL